MKKKRNRLKKALLSSVAAMAVSVNILGMPLTSILPLSHQSISAHAENQISTYAVSVTGGRLTTGAETGLFQVSKLVTVKADAAPSGKKFSHWERNGVKVSTNVMYYFYMPSFDVSLEAVFVEESAALNAVGTAIIESVVPNVAGKKVSFTAALNVPKNCKFVKGGLVATNNASIGESVDASNATYIKLSTKGTVNTKNLKYTWTRGSMTEKTVWYVKGYLVYKDASGAEQTVYSDCVAANINGVVDESGVFFDETTGVLTLKGHVTKEDVAEYKSNSALKEIYAEPGTVLPADCEEMFACSNAEKIDLSNANTSNVTNMKRMFAQNSSLTDLNLNGFNTKKVTNMYAMFEYCYYITSLDLSSFDTSSVTDMERMFYYCQNLEDLTSTAGWDTSKVTSMQYMFCYDSKLAALDVSSWDLSNVTTLYEMFYYCQALTSIDLSQSNMSKLEDASYVFYDCTGLKSAKFGNATTSKLTNVNGLFQYCENLESVDVSTLNTSSVTNMSNMFNLCKLLKSIDVSHFDTSNVTTMYDMFVCCYALESIDVRNFNTSNVQDFGYMFAYCSALTELDVSNFDTSNAQDLSGLFSGCSGLTSLNVSNFNTGSAIDMSYMFNGCSGLTSLDLKDFDTTNVTSYDGLEYMFGGCTNLASLDLSSFDTYNVKNIRGMFQNCSALTSLNVSNFDTSNVLYMSSMFSGCSGLTGLNLSNFNTENVITMYYMFYGCSGLTSLDLRNFDTSNVTDMSNMFNGCSSLSSLDVSGFDTAKVTCINDIFRGCTVLPYVDLSSFDLTKVTKAANYADMFTDSPLLTANLNKFDCFTLYSTGYTTKIKAYFYPSEKAAKAVVKIGDKVLEYGRDDWTLYSGTEYYILPEFVSRSTQSADILELTFYDSDGRQLPFTNYSSKPLNYAKTTRTLTDVDRSYMRIYVNVGDKSTFVQYKSNSKCIYMDRSLLSGLQVPEGYKLYGWKVEDSRIGNHDRVYTINENETWWAYNDVTFTAVLIEKPVREIIEMNLDDSVTTHYEDGDSDTLSFTAETAGTYVFTSEDAYQMTGRIYSNAEMTDIIDNESNNNGIGNFRIKIELDAGQTVYMNNLSTKIQDYTVKVRKLSDTPVTVSALTLDTPATGHYEDIDEYNVFSFTPSEDGVYLFHVVNTKGGISADLYNNADLGYSNNIACTSSYDGSLTMRAVLTAGKTFYLKPTGYYDYNSCDYTVSVAKKVITVREPIVLTLNTEKNGTYTDPDAFDRFSFTAAEAGTYKFTVQNAYGTEMMAYLYNDAALTDELTSVSCNYGDYFVRSTIAVDLAAGQKVYLAAKAYYEDEEFSYTAIVKPSQAIPLTLDETENGHYEDSDNCDSFSFTAAEDGYYRFSGQSYSEIIPELYSNSDLTGYIKSGSYSWGDDGGQFSVGISLSAGQTVYLKPVAEYSENFDYSVNVTKLADMGLKSLALGTAATGHFEDSDAFDYFSFTAEADGTYLFAVENSDYTEMDSFLYNDAELSNVNASWYSSSKSTLKVTLTAGQTVYLVAKASYENMKFDYTATVTQKQATPLILDTPASGHFEDSDNFDYFSFTAPEAGTYAFASSSDYDPVGYLYSDASLEGGLAENDDFDSNSSQFKIVYTLEAGQTVYLKPVDYGEDDSFDYTITVSKAVYGLSAIVLDAAATGHFENSDEYDFFVFTATEDGCYVFSGQCGSSITPELYNDANATESIKNGSSFYNYSDDSEMFAVAISLSAGEKVYFKPSSDSSDFDFTVTVTKKTIGLKTLLLNTSEVGQYVDNEIFDYFSFKAEEAGTYVFTSDCDNDTWGVLYSDSTLKTWLAENDDGGDNSQFRIEYELEEGQTVYLKPGGGFNYTVTVSKT